MSTNNLDQIDISVMLHDINGPLSNLKGFCTVIEDSIIQLVSTINEHQVNLPPDFHKNITDILNEDVRPCLGFSQSVIEQLHVRLDRFEQSSNGTQETNVVKHPDNNNQSGIA